MARKKLTVALATTGLIAGTLGLSACQNSATTSASCGFVVGSGGDNSDMKVHKVLYPNESANVGTDEDVKYVSCNPRNYIINPLGSKNANGDTIGDYHTPLTGYTKDGTKVNVWLNAYWTLNQDRNVLKTQFYPFCEKYQCFSNGQNGKGNVNSASPGWNNMLGENMPATLGQTVEQSLPNFDDSIWKKGADWNQLATDLSGGFNANFRKTTGYSSDMICGSGDVSGWSDPNKPGQGTFKCGAVRFVISNIENADPNQQKLVAQQNQASLQETINKGKLVAAQAAYGSQANYWLGLQDTIQKCKDAGQNCTVVIGGNGSVAVTPNK